jgi:hypothetical protein
VYDGIAVDGFYFTMGCGSICPARPRLTFACIVCLEWRSTAPEFVTRHSGGLADTAPSEAGDEIDLTSGLTTAFLFAVIQKAWLHSHFPHEGTHLTNHE